MSDDERSVSEGERRVAEYIFNGYTGEIPRVIPTPWVHIDRIKWGLVHDYPRRHEHIMGENQEIARVQYSFFTPATRGISTNFVLQPRLSLREMCFMVLIAAETTKDYH